MARDHSREIRALQALALFTRCGAKLRFCFREHRLSHHGPFGVGCRAARPSSRHRPPLAGPLDLLARFARRWTVPYSPLALDLKGLQVQVGVVCPGPRSQAGTTPDEYN